MAWPKTHLHSHWTYSRHYYQWNRLWGESIAYVIPLFSFTSLQLLILGSNNLYSSSIDERTNKPRDASHINFFGKQWIQYAFHTVINSIFAIFFFTLATESKHQLLENCLQCAAETIEFNAHVSGLDYYRKHIQTNYITINSIVRMENTKVNKINLLFCTIWLHLSEINELITDYNSFWFVVGKRENLHKDLLLIILLFNRIVLLSLF